MVLQFPYCSILWQPRSAMISGFPPQSCIVIVCQSGKHANDGDMHRKSQQCSEYRFVNIACKDSFYIGDFSLMLVIHRNKNVKN
jgi:hypothetical protein